ncbi:MAG: hypothetical protein H5T61_12635, partial [Thermoflexales bacterium]|nr:hypothetical protein [Thermoflexales bacterium]
AAYIAPEEVRQVVAEMQGQSIGASTNRRVEKSPVRSALPQAQSMLRVR